MADISGMASSLLDLGADASRMKLHKPRSRFGSVPVNAARAIARGLRGAYDSTMQPFTAEGPDISVRPFDPGSFSVGAMGAKALLALAGGERQRANFRAQQAQAAREDQRKAMTAESQAVADYARAAYYGKRDAGMTDYQRQMLDLRRQEIAARGKRGGGGAGGTALLGYIMRTLQEGQGAMDAEAEAADEAKLQDARTALLSVPYGAGWGAQIRPHADALGLSPAEIRWAAGQQDKTGALISVADAALTRRRAALKAARVANSRRAGYGAASDLMRGAYPRLPSFGSGASISGTPSWINDIMSGWDAQDAED